MQVNIIRLTQTETLQFLSTLGWCLTLLAITCIIHKYYKAAQVESLVKSQPMWTVQTKTFVCISTKGCQSLSSRYIEWYWGSAATLKVRKCAFLPTTSILFHLLAGLYLFYFSVLLWCTESICSSPQYRCWYLSAATLTHLVFLPNVKIIYLRRIWRGIIFMQFNM